MTIRQVKSNTKINLKDEWRTPKWVYSQLDKEFWFGRDVALTRPQFKNNQTQ